MTANILAILGTGGMIDKWLSRLVTAKDAPDELFALNNEVSDFHWVICDVDSLLRKHSDNTAESIPQSLIKALERSKDTLLALEKLITYELMVVKSRPGQVQVDWCTWLRSGQKLGRFKDKIWCDKLNVSTASVIMAS